VEFFTKASNNDNKESLTPYSTPLREDVFPVSGLPPFLTPDP